MTQASASPETARHGSDTRTDAPGTLGWRDIIKPLLVFGFLVAALLLVYLSPWREQLHHLRDLREPLRDSRFGPLLFAAGIFVLTAMGTPRLILCTLGGLIFGFTRGLLLTQVATLAGYYVTFLFVRWGGRNVVLRRWPRLAGMHALLDRHAAWKVMLIRQTPVTGVITNCFFALSTLRHRDFLLGTAVGLIPQAIPATLLGSSAIKTDRGQQFLFLALALLLFLLYLLIRRFVRRSPVISSDPPQAV